MNNYLFYQLNGESWGLFYQAQFDNDADAIAYLPNLAEGTYSITRQVVVNSSTSYDTVIY